MRFYVDGTLVLTEQNRPFGDTPGFWKSSSVADGRHTFEVRAIGRWGTVLATNTVTASVANGAPPNPQSTDTTAPTVAATAPTNGATVSGMINQAVNATDNVGVDQGRVVARRRHVRVGQHGPVLRLVEHHDRHERLPYAGRTRIRRGGQYGNRSERERHGDERVDAPARYHGAVAAEQPSRRGGDRDERHDRVERRDGQRRRHWLRAVQARARWDSHSRPPPVHRTDVRDRVPVGVARTTPPATHPAGHDLAVTTSACADNQAPTAPSNVTASTRTTTSIALTWAAVDRQRRCRGLRHLQRRPTSSTPPPARPASSAASSAAPTTRSRSTHSTPRGTPRPRPR